MTIEHLTELVTAIYTIASILGHLPFLPKSVTDFCNKIALNLKSG